MERIRIDEALLNKLLAQTRGQPVELVTEGGGLIGQFTPAFELAISEEELRRREEPGRKSFTTEEVLEKLRKLA